MTGRRSLHVSLEAVDDEGTAQVTAVLWPDGERATAVFDPPLGTTDREDAFGWIDGGVLDESSVVGVGGALYDELVSGPVRELLGRALDDGGSLPVRLDVNGVNAALPWELLYDTERERAWYSAGGVFRIARLDGDIDILDRPTSVAHVRALDAESYRPARGEAVIVTTPADGTLTSIDVARRTARRLLAHGAAVVVVLAVPDDQTDDDPALSALFRGFGHGDRIEAAIGAAIRARSADAAAGSGLLVVTVPGRRFSPHPAVRWRSAVRRVSVLGSWSRRRLAAIALVLGVIGSAFALADRLTPYLEGPPRMMGSFNIAVASLGVADGSERDQVSAASFATRLGERLERQLTGAPDVPEGIVIRQPADVGQVPGATEEARAEAAAELAGRISADVVIYGAFVPVDGRLVLEPAVYVSSYHIPEAEELSGAHDFGEVGDWDDVGRNLNDRSALLARLTDRTGLIGSFVLGLNDYTDGAFEQAGQRFQAAVDGAAVNSGRGIAVLQLALGNSYAKQQQYSRAAAAYEASLNAEPEYARAHIGMGETTFLRAAGNCDDRTDARALDRAAEHFADASRAEVKPARAAVAERAQFGLARVDVCRTHAGIAYRLEPAQRRLDRVIASLETVGVSTAPQSELAAEAHMARAVVELFPEDTEASDAELMLALKHYQAAARQGIDAGRRSLAWGAVARTEALLGNGDAALAAYRAALDGAGTPGHRTRYRCMVDTLRDDASADRQRMRAALERCNTDRELVAGAAALP